MPNILIPAAAFEALNQALDPRARFCDNASADAGKRSLVLWSLDKERIVFEAEDVP